MRKTSFTSSSDPARSAGARRPLPRALLWTVAAIIAIETALSFALPSRSFNHEVDEILHRIERETFDAEFLLIGDSVGRQILNASVKDDPERKVFAVLASNAAIEMTGQYHLVERYLKKNKAPRAIVFLGRNPIDRDLDQVFTENFVQRVFLRPHEIIGIASLKGVKFGLVMMTYRLLPSYRYRLHLQKRIAGFSTADVYTGLPIAPAAAAAPAPTGPTEPSGPPKQRPASRVYLEKLLDLCERRSIDFYLFAVPMPATAADRPSDVRTYEATQRIWEDLAARHSRFHLIRDAEYFPADQFLKDRVHLKPAGVARAGKLWWESFSWIAGRERSASGATRPTAGG